jgi:hypothetical protein
LDCELFMNAYYKKKLRVGIDIRDSKNPSGVGRYIRNLVTALQSDKNMKPFSIRYPLMLNMNIF